MMVYDDLFKIAERLESQADVLKTEEFNDALQRLSDSAELAGKAWSGSWLGYHSRVYYEGLAEPPPGARFSQEWGMMDTFAIRDIVGDWKEYRFDDVVSAIEQHAGNPDRQEQEDKSSEARELFEESQSQALSLLSGVLSKRNDDKFLQDISEKIKKLKVHGAGDFIEALRPKGQIFPEICQQFKQVCIRHPTLVSLLRFALSSTHSRFVRSCPNLLGERLLISRM